jgi:uncharacterized membrane protein
MIGFGLAIAIHILSVVVWIGGVAMVTTVILPAVRRFKSAPEQLAFFDAIERRFAWQARAMTVLAGASGFYMVHRLQLWPQFLELAYWWLDAMVVIWLLFTVMLFIAEPLFWHRWLAVSAKREPERTFTLVQRLHWVLLILSLATIVGAIAGSHGLSFFG